MDPSDPAFEPHALWVFAVAHYAQPGVAATCLQLQDDYGLDVNVALACLWHERRGGAALLETTLAELVQRTEAARERVRSIRALRRSLRSDTDAQALYRALKHAELVAENLLQRQLVDALDSPGDPREQPGDGRVSLQRYAASLPRPAPSTLLNALVRPSATEPRAPDRR